MGIETAAGNDRLIFTAEDIVEHTRRASFVASPGCRRKFAPHFFEGHALNDDASWTRDRREEQALAAKDCLLDPADELNIVGHAFVKGDDAARVDLQRFAGP